MTLKKGLSFELMKAALINLLLGGWFGLLPTLVSAQDGGFPLTFEGNKQLVTENVYNYKQYKYNQPAEIKFVRRNEASYSSPEQALTALISAMAQTNFEWWLSSWTDDSQKIMLEKDKEMKRTPENWSDIWRKIVAGRRARLLHRIETGPYVLIEYSLITADRETAEGSRDEIISSIFFENVSGKWLATQRLQGDPVGLYWRVPEKRPRAVVRN